MLVKISEELLNNINELENVIRYICMQNGRHSLCNENIRQLLIQVKDHPILRDLVVQLLEKQANGIPFTKVIEVTVNDSSNRKVKVTDLAAKLAKSPIVIVENEINDLKFIKLILHSTGNRNIAEKYGAYWDVSSIGGCGQIPDLVEQKIQTNTEPDSIFVIHDSDRYYPQENLSRTHVNIVNKCKAYNVKFHTLKKREIENYITDELLFDKHNSSEQFRQEWERFSHSQKSHFDFKSGFKKKGASNPIYSGLYSNIDEEKYTLISDGFGDDIASGLYKKENYSYYTQEKISMWCHNTASEFRKISNHIKDLL